MDAHLHADLTPRLMADFAFKQRGPWLRQGVCPNCKKKELYTHAEHPWVLKCGRLNNCGLELHVKELYPDLFDNWSKRYPAEPAKSPNAAADAYLQIGRGFDLARIQGSYTQESYYDQKLGIGSATVRFPFAGTYWERIIDQPQRFGKMKAHVQYGGKFAGQWWALPGKDLASAEEIWITEGIFDAIALMHHGLTAVSAISCSNYPSEALGALLHQRAGTPGKLVFALDGDPAGRSYMRKHVARARRDGWDASAAFIPQTGRHKRDWSDLHLLDASAGDAAGRRHLDEDALATYRYHGDLLLAESAAAKAILMYGHNPGRDRFELSFGQRLYWFELDQKKYSAAMQRLETEQPEADPEEMRRQAVEQSGAVREIANCLPAPLYYQANTVTDESWYYFRVTFPHDSPAIKNTFTAAQLASAGEFKKRLLAIAPGAMYSGKDQHLATTLKRQLYNIKQVQTVDYIGYSKEHDCYVLGDVAVAGGRIHHINDEDYFDIGKLSVKTLARSAGLDVNTTLDDYNPRWIEPLWQAFGTQGLAALTFWFGTLFAEQIRAEQKSFPFLEIVGEAGSGKTTLIEFLWKLLGRADYEGFDPSKSTAAARARNFARVAGLPVVLIESDREQAGGNPKVRSFDWDELKTAFNGRGLRSRGVRNSGNETYEPPFRGAIVISQNNPVDASEAVMTRIMHLTFSRDTQTPESRRAAKALEQTPLATVSAFILAAARKQQAIMDIVRERTGRYQDELLQQPGIITVRIAKCHGQLMALADALRLVVGLSDQQALALRQQITTMAADRQQAIAADHPLVAEFWDTFDYLNGDPDHPMLNHARQADEIAINLNHYIQLAGEHRQTVPTLRELKQLLKSSKRHRYLGQRVVNSVIKERQSRINNTVGASASQRCWIFEARERQ